MRVGIGVRIVLLGCTAALCVPAGAGAKLPGFGLRGYDVRMTGGAMTLEFHGDEATGCAKRGLCDVSGTVTTAARSPAGGGLSLFSAPNGVLGSGTLLANATTKAVVHAPGASDCVDEVTRSFVPFGVGGARGARVQAVFGTDAPSIGVPGGLVYSNPDAGAAVFATRCAGPLPADLRAALPQAIIHRAALAHDRRIAVDFEATRSFARGGFAGTISSDVRLVLDRVPCRGRATRRSCRAFDLAVAG